jgi:hypothetical protein
VTPGVRVAHAARVRAGSLLRAWGLVCLGCRGGGGRKKNIQAVETSDLPFDLVDIANWTPHPSRNLPRSDSDTQTSFLGALHQSSPYG